MKKFISILALLSVFTLNFAQEKEGCCSGKDKKHCSTSEKKACAEKSHKGCEKNKSTAQNNVKTKDSKVKKTKKA
ncbi:MAG: hypothetical protein ACOVRK_05205 [Chryseobacterium taeanense]